MGKKKIIKPETTGHQSKISAFFKKRSEAPIFTVIGSSNKGKEDTNKSILKKSIVSPVKRAELDESDLEIIEATPEIKPKTYKLKKFGEPTSSKKLSNNQNCSKSLGKHSHLDANHNSHIIRPKRAADWKTGLSPNCKRSNDGEIVLNSKVPDLNITPSLDIADCTPALSLVSRLNKNSIDTPTQTILTPTSPVLQIPCVPPKSRDEVSRNLFDGNMHKKSDKTPKSVSSGEEKNHNFGEEEIPDDCLDDLLSEDFERMSPFKKPPVEKESVEIKKHLKEGLCSNSFAAVQGYNRHIVVSVNQDVYNQELHLNLKSIQNGENFTCCLSGSWYECSIHEDDIVHILFTEPKNGHYTVSNKQGLIVVNPDLMISGTSVVSGVFCRRKAVLNEKFKGLEGTSKVMMIGTLVHQLFQEVVKRKTMTKKQLNDLINELVCQRNFLLGLYSLNVTQADIEKEVSAFVPFIHKWSNDYLNGTSSVSKNTKKWNGTITSIQDIEENIWSPRFGVKGKIDLTVKTKTHGIEKVMPLELKTGKATYSIEHKGQVTLYSMMSSDRREDPLSGLLLYLRDGSMSEIPAGENEKRGLIQLRNEIVSYLYQRMPEKMDGEYKIGSLPEPIDNERICSKCPQLSTCTAYSELEKRQYDPGHAMVKLVPDTINHLTHAHLEYFRKWCLMLNLERASDSKNSMNRGLWCTSSEKRELSGDCIANVTLNSEVRELSTNSFLHTFYRDISLPQENFNIGDYVVISSNKEISLAAGSIQEMDVNSVKIVLDKSLKAENRKNFRIDRCEFGATMGLIYSNLAMLLSDDEKSARLRRLIIDKETPVFNHGFRKEIMPLIKPILKGLNKNQQRAILRILLARDYAVLQGYPGTGKTSTIVALIRVLVKLGSSVLVASNTHSAVDNILLKLKDFKDSKILRLGKVSRIHEKIVPFSEEKITKNCLTIEEISECFDSKNVVATTCLGTNHPIFTKKNI